MDGRLPGKPAGERFLRAQGPGPRAQERTVLPGPRALEPGPLLPYPLFPYNHNSYGKMDALTAGNTAVLDDCHWGSASCVGPTLTYQKPHRR